MTQSIEHFNTKIHFGNNLSNQLEELLQKNYSDSKKIIITDENVFELWIEDFITSVESLHGAEIIQLPAGEENKNLQICNHVWEALSDYKIGRQDLIINFGGGVITDLGGFVASTYKRGVRFINIPTTLLSQVDASIGGKTGIDLGVHKNQIGTFSNPDFVFVDYRYLSTLDNIQIKSGYAEMLKHGLISDKNHWNNLTQITNLCEESISPYIFDSVNIKHKIVTEDPKELNLRKSLNFGHTMGHAFESYLLSINNPIPHGFAVAWGILFESKVSFKNGYITNEEFNEIVNTIQNIYPNHAISIDQINVLIEYMQNDKKNENSSINFTLLDGIGNCKVNCELSVLEIEPFLKTFLLN